MSVEKPVMRTVFQKQPIYYLFLDASRSLSIDTLSIIISALKDVVTLAVAMKGSMRIPALGIYYMSSKPVCVFPLASLKDNFAEFNQRTEEMINYVSIFHNDKAFNKQILLECMTDAVNQYEKFIQNLFIEKPALKTVILTTQPLMKFTETVKEITKTLKGTACKKIQIVGIPPERSVARMYNLKYNILNQPGASQNVISMGSSKEGATPEEELLDVVELRNHSADLERFFKSWLHDTSGDAEFLQLQIKNDEMVLYCDLDERVLNPDFFSTNSNFLLATDAGLTQMTMPNQNKLSSAKVPVYLLKAVALIPSPSLCQSLFMGQPLVLRPTTCWKMDFDVLNNNEHQFLAIKEFLVNSDQALIARREVLSLTSREKSPLSTFFAIIPTKMSNSMLIRAITPKELFLPEHPHFEYESHVEIPTTVKENVQKCLNELTKEPMYNPLQYSSGLCEHLLTTLRKTHPQRKQNRNQSNKVSHPASSATHGAHTQLKCNMQSSSIAREHKGRVPNVKIFNVDSDGDDKNEKFGYDFVSAFSLLNEK